MAQTGRWRRRRGGPQTFWRSRKLTALVAISALLVGVRAVLPVVIERYANRTLDELTGYSGQIEDVDLQLFRGAYRIEGVRVEENESFPNKLCQGLVEFTSELLEDQSKDRAAAGIPFKGRLDQPEVGVWSAMGSLLRNAFIEALRRGLEGSVDMKKVAGRDDDKAKD